MAQTIGMCQWSLLVTKQGTASCTAQKWDISGNRVSSRLCVAKASKKNAKYKVRHSGTNGKCFCGKIILRWTWLYTTWSQETIRHQSVVSMRYLQFRQWNTGALLQFWSSIFEKLKALASLFIKGEEIEENFSSAKEWGCCLLTRHGKREKEIWDSHRQEQMGRGKKAKNLDSYSVFELNAKTYPTTRPIRILEWPSNKSTGHKH